MSENPTDTGDEGLEAAVAALSSDGPPEQRLDEAAAELDDTPQGLGAALAAYGEEASADGILTEDERLELDPLCVAARERGVGVTLAGLDAVVAFDSPDDIVDVAVQIYDTPQFDERATEERMKSLLSDAEAAGVDVDEATVVKAVQDRADQASHERAEEADDESVIGRISSNADTEATVSDGGQEDADALVGDAVPAGVEAAEADDAGGDDGDEDFIVGEPVEGLDDGDESEGDDDGPIAIGDGVDEAAMANGESEVVPEGDDETVSGDAAEADTESESEFDIDETDAESDIDETDAESDTDETDAADEAGASTGPLVAGDASVAEALAADLEDGETDEDVVATLSDNLELSLRQSEQVQVDHLQSRVGEFEAYAEALETFLDRVGTADDFADRVDEVEGSIDDVHGRVDEIDERVDEIGERVAAVDDHVEDVADDVAAVQEAVEALEGDVVTDDDLADLEDAVDDVEDDVEDLVEWRENLANVLSGQ